LYKTHLVGQECTTTSNAVTWVALVVYGACLGYTWQEEYLAAKFHHHPSLWPVLNMHLIKNKAPMLALKGLASDPKLHEDITKLEGKLNTGGQKVMVIHIKLKLLNKGK